MTVYLYSLRDIAASAWSKNCSLTQEALMISLLPVLCITDKRAVNSWLVCVHACMQVCICVKPGLPGVCSFCSPEGPRWVCSL